MLKKPGVRKVCTVPNPQSWSSTKKSDGTERCPTTGSVDGYSVLPVTQFVGTGLCVHNTRVSFTLQELPVRGQSVTSNRL